MYFWKCWRETRVRFIVLLILVAAFWWVVHAQALLQNRIIYASLDVLDPADVEGYWKDLTGLIGAYFVLPCFFTMALGAAGVGEEFAQETADFLLTRPRSRGYFIWVSWLTGAVEILTIISVYVLVAFFAAIYVTRTVYTWKFLVMVVPIFLLTMAAYGPICLMTALQRSGRKGYASGLGVIILYILLGALLRAGRSIHLPNPIHLMDPFSGLAKGAHVSAVHFPLAAVIGWSLFAVACPLLAQFYIERREV